MDRGPAENALWSREGSRAFKVIRIAAGFRTFAPTFGPQWLWGV